ncbi:transposase DDE domain protein [bacterium BMS3Abin11]|nr:transposase DDE domain protein [bacterium BMS3Abin11]
MTRDIFGSLFDAQDIRLDKLGNPLLELDKAIDWEAFRPLLDKAQQTKRKSKLGAPRKDVVMIFKGLVIQSLYGLSDDQLEFQVEDRRSFQRFLGLNNHQRSPDAKTFWAFRNRLSELTLLDDLFKAFTAQLNQAGYLARKGQIIDASLIQVPIQRNTREENKQIKENDVPEDWDSHKRRQKDTDARWTQKNGKHSYGYKNHISIDNGHKLIRDYDVTEANVHDSNVHDSNVFDELLDEGNSNKDVWADSAYRSTEQEASLKKAGYRSKVQRKGCKNKKLTNWEKQGNHTRSKTRCRVEHVFGAQSNLRKKAIRSIGRVRARTEIGMMNLVYNMRRFCYLERMSVS